MTRAFRHAILPLLAVLAVGTFAACNDDDGTSPPAPPPALTAAARAALDEALQDAYRTYYTYVVATDDFGATSPFANARETELGYVNALKALYTTRDLTPPASQWSTANVVRYQSREQACMAAEDGEVATELMFERMLRLNLPDDLRGAFNVQRTTAREQHRVAFRACAGGTIPPANATIQAAMAEALQLERKAYFTYQRAVDDLGAIAPFPTIRDAEWLHVGAASNLFIKRDLAVPASAWTLDNVPRYTSRAAACAGAVDAELDLVLTYDRLLLQELPADVEQVFENAREASLESHLAAFQQCAGGGTATPTAAVLDAMREAIQDEYRAFWTYGAVVEDLEPDFPFGPIRDAEESHYTAIANLYVKRSLAVPTSTWSLANVPRFATLGAACAAGVQGETANVAMFDRLLTLALPDDVRQVFSNLRAASSERHLPAFESCAT